MKSKKTAGIVLAAGHGKRMDSIEQNKVTLHLGGKPMVQRTVELLRKVGIKPIVIVVGFQKESVINLFKNSDDIIFAQQKERKGTADAVACALEKISNVDLDVLILQGDDSAFYTKETISDLIKEHKDNNSSFTFLTIDVGNPFGLGRILRSKKDKLLGIVEERDASERQRKIKEINSACYVGKVAFLKRSLGKIKPSSITGEYYLTSLIDLGLSEGEKIHAHKAGSIPWRGVNTKDELSQAQELFSKLKMSN